MEDILPVADIVRRLREINPKGKPKYNPCPSRLRVAEVAREWNKNNPNKRRLIRKPVDARRRARLKGAVGLFTQAEWNNLIEVYQHRCYYCKKKTKLTVDHIIPLSKGGTNFISNIIPACIHCNSSKHNNHKDAQLTLQVTPSMSGS
jgi:5-methylcytosine-specific restriction endonuclease McrA